MVPFFVHSIKKNAVSMNLQHLCFEALYPDPGSNRDGLPHWCLRPARLPIPPSGLLSGCKGTKKKGKNKING